MSEQKDSGSDLIIDGNALFARSYFAAMSSNGNVPDPERTVAFTVNTVLSMLIPESMGGKLSDLNPERVLIAWDGQQNAAKKRSAKPPVYHETRAAARDVLAYLLGVPWIEHDTYEADDLVATAARAEPGRIVIVASSDKDLMQLRSKRVHFYDLNAKALLSEAFICAKFHVKHPQHIALALAIQGDASDAIAGVPRWGPVKVRKIFEQIAKEADFTSVFDQVIAQVPESLQEAFLESLQRTLLNDQVPGVPLPGAVKPVSYDEAQELELPFNLEWFSEVERKFDDIPY